MNIMYTEEVDLCYGLAQAGWALGVMPTAVVIHFGEARARQAKTLLARAYAPRAAIAAATALARPARRPRARFYRRLLVELPGM